MMSPAEYVDKYPEGAPEEVAKEPFKKENQEYLKKKLQLRTQMLLKEGNDADNGNR